MNNTPNPRSAWKAAARVVAVLVLAVFMSTVIDPYLGLASPLPAQLTNAVIPLLAMLLAWGLSGRAWLALAVEAGLLAALAYADHTKVTFLDTDLVYADFTVIGGLLKDPQLVLGFLHPAMLAVGGLALIGVAIALWWVSRRERRAHWAFRAGLVAVAVTAGVLLWNRRAPDVIRPLRWEVFQQVVGAQRVGVAGNILLGRMTARDVKRPPDPAAIKAFWNEPLVRKAEREVNAAGTGVRPDIVVIQSESLFEPSQLCGFSDTPVLQRVAGVAPGLPGNLHVPVFGGRTLQTEFETISGAPIAYYPGSMFAYYELVDHPIDALPRVLDRLGYTTLAMHPNKRGFWRRDTAMPEMGFGTFQDIGSFVYPRDFSERGHVTDAALTRAILSELDSATGPTFVMAVSMDNHGPWGQFAPKDDSALGLPDKVTGEARAQLADYVAHAIDADKAYGFLLDALKRRGRPTIVLFYGDHLPALPPVYEQLCFKDGKPPQKHFPPYRLWANFPIPQPPDVEWAYLQQGLLMRSAGLPLQGHVLANALAGMIAQDPTVDAKDRARVLAEYANIAAANVARVAPTTDKPRTVFVGQDHALDTLMKLEAGRQVGGEIALRYGDLHLAPKGADASAISFDLNGGMASLTLRPSMAQPTAECIGNPQASAAAITVEADGRVLYRARLTPRTLRLATLDTRGIRWLTLRVDQGNQTDICDRVNVRVAQMLCYTPGCNVPASTPMVEVARHAPSRLLAADPIDGDIAALGSLVPNRRKQVASKMANLTWLVGREKGQQAGAAPFRIDQDAQLFMHPSEDHSTWIDFDVTGADDLELTPQINRLTPECKAMNSPGREGGLVGLTVTLDGKPVVPRLLVDRDYARKLPVKLAGGHTLRIEVDKGNQVSSCDWFSVGVSKLDGPALDQPTSLSGLQ
ncbi:LTA synthase family protein [Frateuria sp. GZRR33]|uniref:LTA synthase family protein n=1 Tax=Frateuria sp. GZRR33 TaxID=3351535 RepID=UPI003EDC4449